MATKVSADGQLVIPLADQYMVGDKACFRATIEVKSEPGTSRTKRLETCLKLARDPTQLTVAELKWLSKALGLRGYSKMKKQQLYDAVAPRLTFE